MASTVDLWTPPAGMPVRVVAEWRSFYRAALDNYGVTPAVYRDLYYVQRGRCWICRKAKGKHPNDPRGAGGRRLGVDHNHATGQVRGLLCTGGDKTCNRIIGWLQASGLYRAAEYVDGTLTPALVYAAMGGDVEASQNALWAGSDVPTD